MAVSLPISGALNPPVSRPVGSATPARGADTPAVGLPLAFILLGLLALLTGTVWLVAKPALLATYHYNQYVIAVTHLFVLGWICSIVMGAMYQLVPVALETKLYSERLARWHLALHVVGVVGMVWMFQVWNMKQVGHFGCVLGAGLVLFVLNLTQTLRRVPKWNVTAVGVAAALAWICLAVTVGLMVAAGKSSYESTAGPATSGLVAPLVRLLRALGGFVGHFQALQAMHAHAHLGAVGCFTMLIVGVSYKLIPMFTLSEIQNRSRAAWSIGLLNAGLAGSFVTILLGSPWKLAFTLLVVVALGLYALELNAILRARKRRVLDWGVKYFLTAIALLAPLVLVALVLSWPGLPLTAVTGQLENVYGFLGLLGVISLAIIGMLYKIIPFLVWFRSYSREIGRIRVPMLSDLYSGGLQAAGYWFYLVGLAAACAGTIFASEYVVQVGAGLLSLSFAALALNVTKMLRHFFWPKLIPLTPTSTLAPKPA
jgi:hypothetical protein